MFRGSFGFGKDRRVGKDGLCVVALTQGSIFHGPLSFFPGARIWNTARTESSQGGELGDKFMQQTMLSDVIKSEKNI